MNELFLDLRRSATRQYIYDYLLDRVGKAEDISRAQAAAGLPHKHYHDLPELLSSTDALQVSDRAKQDMRAIYSILAEAEAEVHGCAIEQTHFHEVGRATDITTVLGICLAIEDINPERIIATPVQIGSGTVHCAHGVLDIPAPATAAILAQGIPVCERRLQGELCTPTSAAIIKHFVDEFREC